MTDRLELLSLRDAIENVLGFGFEEDRLAQLGETVRSRIAQLGLTGISEYVRLLGSDEHRRRETPILAELITVTETFFYRNVEQIMAMVEVAVPLLARKGKRVRILSAGCASGEEPYSLVIALREALPDFDEWDLQVLGVDVNPAMLHKAERATYSRWALRATPEVITDRYLKATGKEYVLSEERLAAGRFST
jgi:chemotaxis protein methyltransferase CheR